MLPGSTFWTRWRESGFPSVKLLLTDPQTINIVIGWEDTRSSKTAIAYRYQNGRLTSIFERDYAEIAIADLDSNGTTDLCLLTPQAQSTLLFLACSTDSGFETVDSLTLPHGIVSFDSILAGRTANGQTALFLDSTVDLYDTSFQITDVISARRREDGSPALVNLLDNENLSLSKLTLRPMQNLFCRDIDNDSIIEIPTASTLPGYLQHPDPERTADTRTQRRHQHPAPLYACLSAKLAVRQGQRSHPAGKRGTDLFCLQR